MRILTKPKLRELRFAAKSLSLFVAFAVLLNGSLPVLAGPPAPPSTQQAAKLSGALRSVLTSDEFSVWSDPTTQRLRVLIQSEGPVSAGLLTAVCCARERLFRLLHPPSPEAAFHGVVI
jgi:hypothetical protein